MVTTRDRDPVESRSTRRAIMPEQSQGVLNPRMNNPAMVLPEAMQALLALGAATKKATVPARTIDLVHLRASQINGCSVCVDMHSPDLKKARESDERLFPVAACRDAPY